MDYFRLMLKNAARNRRRTLLTMLSMAVSLFLLVSLRTLLSELEGSSFESDQSVLRLITRHAVSLQVSLPLNYRQRIERVPGVKLVTPWQWFGGYYRDPMDFFPQFGADPEVHTLIGSDYWSDPAELEAYKKDRTGAQVAGKLMERFGWKIGDRITIISRFFPFNLELTIRSSYVGAEQNSLWFHYDYFNELMRSHFPTRADRVTSFYLMARTREDVPRVAAAIDEMFRNSEAPTRTETEKAFTLSFTSMLGNVKLFMTFIAAAVVFAILLVTMNTMAMSVRERTGEIAVLKTLGFRRRTVLGLLVGESVLIALAGGLLGVASAKLFFGTFDMYKLTQGVIQNFNISPVTIGVGLSLAALVGIASAAVPAWRVVNGSIASALRQVG